MAVAHRVLLIAYYIIRDGVEYHELGGDYHDRLHPLRTTKRLLRRLENLGFVVDLRAQAEAEPAQPAADPPQPRKRGRPKGSRNTRPPQLPQVPGTGHPLHPPVGFPETVRPGARRLPQMRSLGHPLLARETLFLQAPERLFPKPTKDLAIFSFSKESMWDCKRSAGLRRCRGRF
ncbi:MAG TPA: hypothetical protein VE621_17295 [Bryobacteraceae bacterium]|nr:hypothetical protein [Bryobacteraceae bacterium]